ncbi:hypothetical protein AB0942_00865 [Streptomyces nodosus]|uniref:hypothetical protein n=1 Tax=Streptomyces nodosus TaxID=40318 RepID=UPI0034515DF1
MTVINDGHEDIQLFGCPHCTDKGVRLVGDPDALRPRRGAGSYFGWTETRHWPVKYTVSLHGVTSICPATANPVPDVSRDFSVTYDVTDAGKCLLLTRGVGG